MRNNSPSSDVHHQLTRGPNMVDVPNTASALSSQKLQVVDCPFIKPTLSLRRRPVNFEAFARKATYYANDVHAGTAGIGVFLDVEQPCVSYTLSWSQRTRFLSSFRTFAVCECRLTRFFVILCALFRSAPFSGPADRSRVAHQLVSILYTDCANSDHKSLPLVE